MKYLIFDQMTYLEQIYTRLLDHVDNLCWQYDNELYYLSNFQIRNILIILIFGYLIFSDSK